MAGSPVNQKNNKSCKDLAPKGHLKATGIAVSNKTIKELAEPMNCREN